MIKHVVLVVTIVLLVSGNDEEKCDKAKGGCKQQLATEYMSCLVKGFKSKRNCQPTIVMNLPFDWGCCKVCYR